MADREFNFVVVDPRLIATAFVARSDGRCPRLLALLALGRFRVSVAGVEAVKKLVDVDEQLERVAKEGLDRARAALPREAPDTFALAWSTPLRDELRDALHYQARELPSVRGHDEWVASVLHQVATCVIGTNASDDGMQRVHRYTSYADPSRRGDYLVQTAIQTGAGHVVSNDESVAPRYGRRYHCLDGEGGSTMALPLSRFVADHVESDEFSLSDVDRDAFEAVNAAVTPTGPVR